MGLLQRMQGLDDRVGIPRSGPAAGESRRDYLRRVSTSRLSRGPLPVLMAEIAELGDQLDRIEQLLLDMQPQM